MNENNDSMKITEYWGPDDQEEYPAHLIGIMGVLPMFILVLRKLFIRLGMVFVVFDKLAVLIVSLVFALVIHHKNAGNVVLPDYVHPSVLLAFIFPLKILKITYNLDLYLIRKCFLNIILLSMLGAPVIGVIYGLTILVFDKSVNLKLLVLYALLVAPNDDLDWSLYYKEYEVMKLPLTILEGEFLITNSISLMGVQIYSRYPSQKWYFYSNAILGMLFGGIGVGLLVGKLYKIIMSRLIFNMRSTLCCILMIITFTYNVCENILYVSGPVAISMVVLYINSSKSLMSQTFQAHMSIGLESMTYGLTAFVHFLVYTQTFLTVFKGLDYSVTEIIISSWISTILRSAMILMVAPIMRRLNKTLDFKSFLCLIWMSTKGIIQVLEAELIYFDKKLSCGISVLGQLFCSIIFELVIRALFSNKFMSGIGLTDVSQVKKGNFTNAIKIIEDKRINFVDTMRNKRTFAEVKWNFITTSTNLSEYLIKLDKDLLLKTDRTTYCGECKKDVIVKPLRRELFQLLCDSRVKVLKAKKKYLLRLYERGMVDMEHVRFLMQDIETAERGHTKFSITHVFKLFEKKNCIDKLLKFLSNISKEEIVIRKPRNKFRILCYKLVMCKWYELVLYATVVGAFIENKLIIHEVMAMHYVHIPFVIIFALDFVLKINAYSRFYISDGFHTYFRDDWNKMDFVLLLLNITTLFVLPITYLYPKFYFDNQFAYHWLKKLFTLPHLRLLKLILTFYVVKPYIMKMCNNIIENRISFAFNAGQAMLVCYEEVIHNLPTLISYVDIYDQIYNSLDEDRKELVERLRFAHLYLPQVIANCKTRFVSRAILYTTNETIKELRTKGQINKKEYDMLREIMAAKFRKSSAQLISGPVAPHIIFTSQPWLDGYDNIDFLLENLKVLTFKPEETLIRSGELADGMFIITEGCCHGTYEPDEKTLERLAINGILPVVDEINFNNFASVNNQVFFTGHCLGILSVLTNRVSSITITSKKKTKAFFLDRFFLRQFIENDYDLLKGLYSRLWKFVARDLATAILWEVTPYINMPKERVFQYFDESLIPNLTNKSNFEVSEVIGDIVLVEGTVVDKYSNSLFRGPCRVPRTTRSLILNSHAILLIVPRENAKPSLILEVRDERLHSSTKSDNS